MELMFKKKHLWNSMIFYNIQCNLNLRPHVQIETLLIHANIGKVSAKHSKNAPVWINFPQ